MLLNSFFKILDIKDTGDTTLDVKIWLNSEHEIYQAHFPGHPITPGVCEIQMTTEILAVYLGKEIYLTDIKNVKYMSVISPEKVTELTVHFQKITSENDSYKVIVIFKENEQVFSKMSMTYHVVRNNSNI